MSFSLQLQDGGGIACDPLYRYFQRNLFPLDTFPHFLQEAGCFSNPNPLELSFFIEDRHASLTVRRNGEPVA